MAGQRTSGKELLEGVEGSRLAKERLWALVETLAAQRTIVNASKDLELCESAFYKMRARWLEEAVDLLEPRKPGRKPRVEEPAGERIEALEEEVRSLKQELRGREVREEIAVTMPRLVERFPSALKKTT